MDTTENKTEQYTKREFPKFKPQANGEYLCGNRNFAFLAIWDNDCWAVRNPDAIAWFFEPSPMEVKDAEAIMSLLKKAESALSDDGWVKGKLMDLIKETFLAGKTALAIEIETNSIREGYVNYISSKEFKDKLSAIIQSPKPVEGDVSKEMQRSQYEEEPICDCGEILDWPDKSCPKCKRIIKWL